MQTNIEQVGCIIIIGILFNDFSASKQVLFLIETWDVAIDIRMCL